MQIEAILTKYHAVLSNIRESMQTVVSMSKQKAEQEEDLISKRQDDINEALIIPPFLKGNEVQIHI